MKIKHFLYNTFLIESRETKIAIDPGQNLGLFKLASLIPESEWQSITHIIITHGDPDHYWQTDRVAAKSNASVICGRELSRTEADKILLVDPRGKGLTSWVPIDNVYPLDVGESVVLKGVKIEALISVHGPIIIPILWFTLRRHPGPKERTGLGSMGFKIIVEGKTIVNLGDSIFQKEWAGLRPDVLMLPIGGLGNDTWTMDVSDAIEVVKIISPGKVIPCHYNVPFLWVRNAAPADDQLFKQKIESLGIECCILQHGDEIEI